MFEEDESDTVGILLSKKKYMNQDLNTLQNAFLEDRGNCRFKVFGYATTNKKLSVVKALKDIYDVTLVEIKDYIESLPINGFGGVILLDCVSEATCRKLKDALEKIQIECDYYYI